jgi:hypothetical protein
MQVTLDFAMNVFHMCVLVHREGVCKDRPLDIFGAFRCSEAAIVCEVLHVFNDVRQQVGEGDLGSV